MRRADSRPFLRAAAELLGDRLRTDEVSRLLYSTDASLYQIIPLGVAFPRDAEEILKLVETAAEEQVPLLARGAGTSLAGQTVTDGLVLDFSRFMNRVIDYDPDAGRVTVEPGIVLDELNARIQGDRLFFAPDVATANRATVGGMAGNNSSGMRSIRYGKTVDHVGGVEAVLSPGEILYFGPPEATKDRPNSPRLDELRQFAMGLVKELAVPIEQRYPKVPRRVSGYNLDELLRRGDGDLAPLLVGSEGTLGVVTRLELNLEPLPAARSMVVLHFSDLLEALRAVPRIVAYSPTAVELLDRYGLGLAAASPHLARQLATFVSGDPAALLIVEFSEDSTEAALAQVERLAADRELQSRIYHLERVPEPERQVVVWGVRKNALGIMLGVRDDFKPVPFIEDSCVPVESLADYIAEVEQLCRRVNRRLALYAHVSVGVVHVRPFLNLRQEEDVRLLEKLSHEVFQLVLKYGGSWSGEHGDGLARSYKLPEFFGPEIYEAFRRIKKAFDPAGIMNPGKIVDAPPPTRHLRIHPGLPVVTLETGYQFREERGFDRALELCTGVGHCRKTLAGVMCPSYMATRDEEDSTRGRANALRAALAGQLSLGLADPRVYEVLDLCLECKACKAECPSGVDMARLKAEFLYHYYRHHPRPLGKRLVAALPRLAAAGARTPALANLALRAVSTGGILPRLLGFDPRRPLPALARRPFRETVVPVPKQQAGDQVTVFADTFTEYFDPGPGQATVRLLARLGFTVAVRRPGCCGRTAISAGDLDAAKIQARAWLTAFRDVAGPIVVVEPSCFATIRDDYPDLVDDRELVESVLPRVYCLEEFLLEQGVAERLRYAPSAARREILFHPHCQQRSVIGVEPSVALLEGVSDVSVRLTPDTCCGMAGSFGYESGHYDISRKIAERALVPAINATSDRQVLVVAGFSCRTQVRHLTGRRALHPAEFLAEVTPAGRE
ncbi:MAG: FAD-binding and (Fe-S)-binding domain-containing protein [Acidobacteriota bacterium]